MKRILSASLLAILACSVTAQAEDTAVQPCTIGSVCNSDVGGTGIRDLQIHGMYVPGTYQCTFTVTGANPQSPKKVKIVNSRNHRTIYPQLIGKTFKLNEAPLVVDALPPGPTPPNGIIIAFQNDWGLDAAEKDEKNTETRFSVQCIKKTA
jgi:hypothetical protein